LLLQLFTSDTLLGLPYWDWSVDNNPNDLSFWGPLFMGGNGGGASFNWQVMDGPFAFDARKDGDPQKWVLNVRIEEEEPTNYLRRQFGKDPDGTSLPTPEHVQAALRATPYDVAPWDDHSASGFRNIAEGWIGPGMHNRVHVWVGGSMGPMTSPNDPVFFLHHCFVDKLWADWQAMHKNDLGYQPYLPSYGARKGHNFNDPMPPWDDVHPIDMLDHRKLGYRYDTEDYLLAGEELYPGQWIWSADRSHYLYYGRLKDQSPVLLSLVRYKDGYVVWQSPSTSAIFGRCMMREDGNLIIYNPAVDPHSPNPIWQSGTAGNPDSRLVVQNGKVVMFNPKATTPFWTKP
jgi:hypothetical protein